MLDATDALISHKQFPAAARAAPEFTAKALDTITALEARLSIYEQARR